VSFILAAERDDDCSGAFRRYREYLLSTKTSFPPNAYALATSDWYFDFTSRGCPHDALLQSITISDSSSTEHVPPSITIRLRAAKHPGVIQFYYPHVFSYQLTYDGQNYGHQDWRYDEFRLADNGHLIHEIEWCGAIDTGRWLIEATDVIHS